MQIITFYMMFHKSQDSKLTWKYNLINLLLKWNWTEGKLSVFQIQED